MKFQMSNKIINFMIVLYDCSMENKKGLINSISQVARKSKVSYSYAFTYIKQLEKEKIVSSYKEGRSKYIVFTEKGYIIIKDIMHLKQYLK